jgi:hypothetical protein
VDDGNISSTKLVIELEEDVSSSLGARLTGSRTGLKGCEEGLLRGQDHPPPLPHGASCCAQLLQGCHGARYVCASTAKRYDVSG